MINFFCFIPLSLGAKLVNLVSILVPCATLLKNIVDEDEATINGGSGDGNGNGEITSLGLKMERKNINQCVGGLRIEDQGVHYPQTFLVKNSFFLQLTATKINMTIGALSRVSLNTNRGFKAGSWTLENKNSNAQYYFEVEFNRFFQFVARQRKNRISCFLISFTHQVEFFLSIIFNVLALHLFNFE